METKVIFPPRCVSLVDAGSDVIRSPIDLLLSECSFEFVEMYCIVSMSVFHAIVISNIIDFVIIISKSLALKSIPPL